MKIYSYVFARTYILVPPYLASHTSHNEVSHDIKKSRNAESITWIFQMFNLKLRASPRQG